jgi:hypothetical protein
MYFNGLKLSMFANKGNAEMKPNAFELNDKTSFAVTP